MINKKILILMFFLITIFCPESFSESGDNTGNVNLLDKRYFEQGMVFITPGGANYTLGYWWKRMGFRFTVAYLPLTLFGSQIEARIRIVDKVKIRHSLSVGVGTTLAGGSGFIEERNISFNYLAGFYNIRFKIFFTQIGLGGGFGTIKSPQALLQCGFLFRKDSKAYNKPM